MLIKQLFAFAGAIVFFVMPVSAQDEDIKQVIEKETDAYFKKNIEEWTSVWLQDPGTSRTFTSAFEYRNSVGADSIIAKQTRSFKKYPKAEPVEIKRSNYRIRKEGKIAIVDFQQQLKFTDNQPPFDEYASDEHRILVKSNGKWKIAAQSTTETSLYNNPSGEMTLNNAGYAFMAANKLDEAIQILELNTKFYPESYNVWDSLGEAYAKAGKKEQAIQNYEKSLQINPKSEGGKAALEELKK